MNNCIVNRHLKFEFIFNVFENLEYMRHSTDCTLGIFKSTRNFQSCVLLGNIMGKTPIAQNNNPTEFWLVSSAITLYSSVLDVHSDDACLMRCNVM
jgi:hypothetical protein